MRCSADRRSACAPPATFRLRSSRGDRPALLRQRSGCAPPPEAASARIGYTCRVADNRRYETEELLVRPGTYFNPQTEVL
ncbi:MAG: hypothetical protein ACR2F4_03100, partial [Thermoleophilaceae bacterium]